MRERGRVGRIFDTVFPVFFVILLLAAVALLMHHALRAASVM